MVPDAWRKFLQRLAVGNGTDSDLRELPEVSGGQLEALLEAAAVGVEQWRRELALVALVRGVLGVLPAIVVERPEESCRDVVERRLAHVFGAPPLEEDVELVMTVVKRMQLYRRVGRSGIGGRGVSLEKREHRKLLRVQEGRCRACGYKFLYGDLSPDPSAGEVPHVDGPIESRDRSPRRIRRRAVLDHVLPVYLGGDDAHNWQLLCRTCNEGKSDMLFGFESRHWFGTARLGDLTRVSARLFYMVLSRDRTCSKCSRGANRTELRIVRRDENGANLYPNLVVCCAECLGK
jgi:5-methylcytosine-specific restriction endonuclease McrA